MTSDPVIVQGSGGLFMLAIPVDGTTVLKVVYVHASYGKVAAERDRRMAAEKGS